MKKIFRFLICFLAAFLITSGYSETDSLPFIEGTITAEAASSSVKALSTGKSYTISGYAKVTSSKTSVATAKKKASQKYTVKAVGKGTATIKCYSSAGKLLKTVYLIATDSSTLKYNSSAQTLVKGKTKTVAASVQSGCTVKYSSSNKSIATVSGKGKITAKKAGTAKITASVYYRGRKIKSATKTVKVVDYTYDSAAVTLSPGKTLTVKATVASGYKVKYSSSDKSVATVSSSGKITAVEAGSHNTYIYAKIYYGNTLVKTYSKKVTVRSYNVPVHSSTMYFEESQTVKCAYYTSSTSSYSYDSGDTFTWITSNPSVLSISTYDNKCVITAVNLGSATITCKINGLTCSSFKITVQYSEAQKLRIVQPTDYTYEVYCVGTDKIFSNYTTCLYIKTDNPNSSTIAVATEFGEAHFLNCQYSDINYTTYRTYSDIIGSSGAISVSGSSVYDFMVMVGNLSSVPSGYIAPVMFSAGDNNIYINEKDADGNYRCVQHITVNALDTNKYEEEWMQWLVTNCTTSDMTSFEKMDAVCDYLIHESGYTYLHTLTGSNVLLSLTSDCVPYYICKAWDSYISPYALEDIAETIGGFDYIHCCYYDYTVGSTEWQAVHAITEVGIGDDIRSHCVCPAAVTGALSAIQYIDFTSSEDLTKIGDVNGAWSWSDYYPNPSKEIVSSASAASIADSENPETEEIEEIEISLFSDEKEAAEETEETEESLEGMIEKITEETIEYGDEIPNSEAEEIIVENDDPT